LILSDVDDKMSVDFKKGATLNEQKKGLLRHLLKEKLVNMF